MLVGRFLSKLKSLSIIISTFALYFAIELKKLIFVVIRCINKIKQKQILFLYIVLYIVLYPYLRSALPNLQTSY